MIPHLREAIYLTIATIFLFPASMVNARVFCNADPKLGNVASISGNGAQHFLIGEAAFVGAVLQIERANFKAASQAGNRSAASLREAATAFEKSFKAVDSSLNAKMTAIELKDVATLANVSLSSPFLIPVSWAIARGDAGSLFTLCKSNSLKLADFTESVMGKMEFLKKDDPFPLKEISALLQEWHRTSELGTVVTAAFVAVSKN